MLRKKLFRIGLSCAVATGMLLGLLTVTHAAERVVHLAGWGAKSGVLRSFGVNSEAVYHAAIKEVNDAGGIKMGDGTMAKMELAYYDSACNAEQGIAVARKVASTTQALIGFGPTCSGVAAASFGIFQKKVDDPSDSGLQFPILTDTAVRNGLAKISQWTFRNTPNEPDMYDKLFAWVRKNHNDTNFSVQARKFKKSQADLLIVSSHPFTTCGLR